MSIDLSTLEDLLEQERQERIRRWEEWVRQPAPMQFILRVGPTTYLSKPLPPQVQTGEKAEAFASEYAQRHGKRLLLVLSRRRSVWIDADGKIESWLESTPDCPDLPLLRLVGNISTFLVEE